jgi:hypothetical protein
MKMIHRKNSRPPRGIGLMTTIITMSFVAVMILALGYLFAAQMRRTRHLPQANQQRQLLLAGGDILIARLNAAGNPIPAFKAPLPAEAKNAIVECVPDPAAPAGATRYILTATSGGFSMRDIVTIKKIDGNFRITEAALSKEIH